MMLFLLKKLHQYTLLPYPKHQTTRRLLEMSVKDKIWEDIPCCGQTPRMSQDSSTRFVPLSRQHHGQTDLKCANTPAHFR